MTIEDLKARLIELEKERDGLIEQANAAINKVLGAIALLNELISKEESEQDESKEIVG